MLSVLTRSRELKKWKGSVIPLQVLDGAIPVIESELGLTFEFRELYDRFQFFEKRHREFRAVTAVKGVFWDVNTNIVTAPDPVWNEIFQTIELGIAYYHIGEPEYPRLMSLFGHNAVKREGSFRPVVISDTTLPRNDRVATGKPNANIEFETTLELSHSVSSPLMPEVSKTKTRRKLFENNFNSFDSESINEPPQVHYIPSSSGELLPRVDSKFPPRPSKKEVNLQNSPFGSSCGSTNMNKWRGK